MKTEDIINTVEPLVIQFDKIVQCHRHVLFGQKSNCNLLAWSGIGASAHKTNRDVTQLAEFTRSQK